MDDEIIKEDRMELLTIFDQLHAEKVPFEVEITDIPNILNTSDYNVRIRVDAISALKLELIKGKYIAFIPAVPDAIGPWEVCFSFTSIGNCFYSSMVRDKRFKEALPAGSIVMVYVTFSRDLEGGVEWSFYGFYKVEEAEKPKVYTLKPGSVNAGGEIEEYLKCLNEPSYELCSKGIRVKTSNLTEIPSPGTNESIRNEIIEKMTKLYNMFNKHIGTEKREITVDELRNLFTMRLEPSSQRDLSITAFYYYWMLRKRGAPTMATMMEKTRQDISVLLDKLDDDPFYKIRRRVEKTKKYLRV